MHITNNEVYRHAKSVISQLYGEKAKFREGQYEAIEATLLNKRTLVVQRTGWGKSLVYFICTKLFRKSGRGVTFVVSPLLVLMENQLDAAKKLGLQCETLNSMVKDRREDIIDLLISNSLDLLFITPETLLSGNIYKRLKDINIGFFVIDEAHCISDWGHDFRLQYTQLSRVVRMVDITVPILATTATANNRVVEDLKTQLGGDVYVSRGSLMRKTLSIQVLKIPNPAKRYAWILQNINNLPGSGIIYCLTRRDCDYLSDFLQKNNIDVRSYYSRDENSEYINKEAESLFKDNKIKALVATVKLGMGYDKDDIAFVIHYQQPSNIVSYYQQIGRAGRNIPRAYTFLMCGDEDKKIQDYFIDTAFPSKDESEKVLKFLYDHNEEGSSRGQICSQINNTFARIDKTLMFLENEGYAYKEKNRYYASPKSFTYNEAHYNAITEIRRNEQALMDEMIKTTTCYSKFIVNCLDDPTDNICGKCTNCLGYDEYPADVSQECLELAQHFFERLIIQIEPRKKWATTSLTSQTMITYKNEIGICLSKYGDPGYGTLVREDKYSTNERFREELIGKSVSVLKSFLAANEIDAITCVPSLRSSIVHDFAERLAKRLGIEFAILLRKNTAMPQKAMQNSSYQCENALQSFSVIEDAAMPENILLVDDVVDSRWTLTVCGSKLIESGCSKVYPFALADSSRYEE